MHRVSGRETTPGQAMAGMHSITKVALLVLGLFDAAHGFTYSLDDTFYGLNRCSYTEGWMFGSNKGPRISSQGPSYVHADLKVSAIPVHASSTSFNISMMFYRSNVRDYGLDLNMNICPRSPAVSSQFMDLEVVSFPVSATQDGEGDDQLYVANIKAHRDVASSGLQHAFLQVCPAEVDIKTLMVEGELAFHNPYGYLPGMDYGCLPFEVCRVVASIALGLFFTFAMWRHRETVLPVHYMILGVVVLGTFEAASWLIAYSYMNKTGKPYCCPYPGTVILAMIMEVLRRTTSRFLLLMICLGFGITRVQLEKRELIAVVTLTMAFLASGIVQLASAAASASNVRKGNPYTDFSPLLAVPALFTDMIFLTWIYGTLANMIKELRETNETYKLNMYKALAWTLGTFVTLFTTLTIAMLAAEGSQQQSWEWKWEWVQVVSWEILNFCMLLAVSVIWRPSPRSAMLAYSKQLATTESAAEEADGIELEAVEMQGPRAGHFTIGEQDADSDEGVARNEDGPGFGDGDVRGVGADEGDNSGTVYALANFEPQRNTDLT